MAFLALGPSSSFSVFIYIYMIKVRVLCVWLTLDDVSSFCFCSDERIKMPSELVR